MPRFQNSHPAHRVMVSWGWSCRGASGSQSASVPSFPIGIHVVKVSQTCKDAFDCHNRVKHVSHGTSGIKIWKRGRLQRCESTHLATIIVLNNRFGTNRTSRTTIGSSTTGGVDLLLNALLIFKCSLRARTARLPRRTGKMIRISVRRRKAIADSTFVVLFSNRPKKYNQSLGADWIRTHHHQTRQRSRSFAPWTAHSGMVLSERGEPNALSNFESDCRRCCTCLLQLDDGPRLRMQHDLRWRHVCRRWPVFR